MNKQIKTIAIVSGGAKTGKTFLSISLAYLLAKKGLKVLLIDAGYGYQNVLKQLNLEINKKLEDLFNQPLNDQKITIKELGFDIIATENNQNYISGLPKGLVQKFNRDVLSLKPHYDKIIVDIGGNDIDKIEELTKNFSLILALATEAPESLTQTFSFVKEYREKAPTADIKIIINFAQSTLSGERNFYSFRKACLNYLKETLELLGTIRFDNNIKSKPQSLGHILKEIKPEPIHDDIKNIAEKIIN